MDEKTELTPFEMNRWSLIQRYQEGVDEKRGRRALEELCRIYWPPLYSFARRKGSAPHDAEDLTQSFFSKMLQKDFFSEADRNVGTMRSFLLTAFQNFMCTRHHSNNTLKRGGRNTVVAIDSEVAEELHRTYLNGMSSPEAEFDKRWALAMLEKCLKQLEDEYTKTGRMDVFNALLPYVEMDGDRVPAAAMAGLLGMTPEAVRQAGHRLRTRFSTVLSELVRQTLRQPSQGEIEEEVEALKRALRRG